jgi:hypothetical protein
MLGYESLPAIVELGRRSTVMKPGQVLLRERWKPGRGILEYLSLVEGARAQLIQIGSLRADSQSIYLAKYHSIALIVFSRATLDLAAGWLVRAFELQLGRRGERTLGRQLSNSLQRKGLGDIALAFDRHSPFLQKHTWFRTEWVHRSHGGVSGFADKAPDRPDANPRLGVPIEPDIDPSTMKADQYFRRVSKCRAKNGGNWVQSVEPFANNFADNTRDVCIDLLAATLLRPD